MDLQLLSLNNNVNTALKNIIIIIKNIKIKYNYTLNKIAILLGLKSSKNENDHIISYSLNYKLNNYIYEDIDEINAKLLINNNLLIIYKEVIIILKNKNNINQSNLSKELGLNKLYDKNNWIIYVFVELMNDANIIKITKLKKIK